MNEEPTPPILDNNRDIDWSTATDSTLIQNCLQNNEIAWATLIARYSRLIYTIPFRFGFSKMAADEIFQETCIVLLEGLHKLEAHDRINSWLMTVTKRLCIQRMREQGKATIEQLNDELRLDSVPVEEKMARVEQTHLVHEALSFLPERDQIIIKSLYLQEQKLSYDQLAARLNVSKGSIGALRARSLGRLQEQIDRLNIVD